MCCPSAGNDGEVYKQVSQLAIGIVTEGQQARGRTVNLNSLPSGLSPEAMRGLVGELGREGAARPGRDLKGLLDACRVPTEVLERRSVPAMPDWFASACCVVRRGCCAAR